MSLSKKKDSKFLLTLLVIEVVALCPFIAKAFEGRAVVFWSHAGLKPYFFGAIILLAIGVSLALSVRNRSVGIAAAIILAIPMFILPFLEMAIITSISGY